MDPSVPDVVVLIAGERETGVACPHCRAALAPGDEVAQCSACGMVHHHDCWKARGGCGSYACAPARSPSAPSVEATLRITEDDLAAAAPLPAPARDIGRMVTPRPPEACAGGRNRLATAALVCGLIGLVLGGTTAIPAIVLGCIAIATIQRNRQRGLAKAAGGIVLGFVGIVGWIVVAATFWPGGGRMIRRVPDMDLDPASLEAIDPAIAGAMRANVVISSKSILNNSMGSGVVVKIDGNVAYVATNRHVVDPSFDPQGSNDESVESNAIVIRMLGQPPADGRVVWAAPGAVDLAIVSAPCHSREVREAKYPPPRSAGLGDPVFAIGNPQALGWTFSPGSVSQFRTWNLGAQAVRVIQTSAPINSGNSGGGLYDKNGYLIGINTWTEDKRVSEGLGFAMAISCLLELAPPHLLSVAPPGVSKP